MRLSEVHKSAREFLLDKKSNSKPKATTLRTFVLILLFKLKYASISCHESFQKNNVWISELSSY